MAYTLSINGAQQTVDVDPPSPPAEQATHRRWGREQQDKKVGRLLRELQTAAIGQTQELVHRF